MLNECHVWKPQKLQKNWLNPLSLNKNSIMIFEKLEFMASLESSWTKCKMWSKTPWAMEIKQWAMEPRAMENSNMVWGVIFSPVSCFQMGYDWIRPNEAFNLQWPANYGALLCCHIVTIKKRVYTAYWNLSHRHFGNLMYIKTF